MDLKKLKYRQLGRTNLTVSEIGLGLEHLHGQSQKTYTDTIQYALSKGINYFDPIFSVADDLNKIRNAFGTQIDKQIITVHLRSKDKDGQFTRTQNGEESLEVFEKYSKLLNIKKFKIGFLTFVMKSEYSTVFGENGEYSVAKSLKEQGKIEYIGMSTHNIPFAKKIIEQNLIDVLMVPINLIEWNRPQRKDLLSLCKDRNIGLIGMKPYSGGKILQKNFVDNLKFNYPKFINTDILIPQQITPFQCLSFVLSHNSVHVALNGVKNLQEIQENLDYYKNDIDKSFSNLLPIFSKYIPGICVYCNHCQPCPAKIDIAEINRLLDQYNYLKFEEEIDQIHQTQIMLKNTYKKIYPNLSNCIECWKCVIRCPFDVKLYKRFTEIKKKLGDES